MHESSSSTVEPVPDAALKEVVIGVWKIVLGRLDPQKLTESYGAEGLRQVAIALSRMFKEIYLADPRLFILYLCAIFWEGINGSISAYVSNLILQTVCFWSLEQSLPYSLAQQR
jgi:hypothetical protein